MHAADGSEEAEEAAARETENPAKEGSSGDHWPADPKEQDALIVELDRLGREQLRGQEPDALRRARIVDKQSDILLRRKRRGNLPAHPRAWFRKLVDHGFRSSKIPYGRNHVPLDLVNDPVSSPEDDNEEQRRRARQDWLRENIGSPKTDVVCPPSGDRLSRPRGARSQFLDAFLPPEDRGWKLRTDCVERS